MMDIIFKNFFAVSVSYTIVFLFPSSFFFPRYADVTLFCDSYFLFNSLCSLWGAFFFLALLYALLFILLSLICIIPIFSFQGGGEEALVKPSFKKILPRFGNLLNEGKTYMSRGPGGGLMKTYYYLWGGQKIQRSVVYGWSLKYY